MFRCNVRNPSGAYIAQNYASAKRIIWDYLKDYTKNFPGRVTNESELKVTIPRRWRDDLEDGGDKVTIQLFGSEKYDSIRGVGFEWAVFDEYAFSHKQAWTEVIRPTLADNKGSAIIISTPNGMNHFYQMYKEAEEDMLINASNSEWYCDTITAENSGVIDPDELKSIRKTVGEEAYQQEFMCSFTAQVKGAYYQNHILQLMENNQIKDFAIDLSQPVHLAFDLGIGDSTAIWFFQLAHNEIHVVDYYEASGLSLVDYVKVIKEKPYVIGETILPHDAAARSLETGNTRQDSLRKLGLHQTRILPRQSVEDGINAVRMVLPRCYFHKTNCERGLECLKFYHKEYNDKLETFINKPVHDWSSHGADAFRYLALGLERLERRSYGDDRNLPRQAESYYDIFSA